MKQLTIIYGDRSPDMAYHWLLTAAHVVLYDRTKTYWVVSHDQLELVLEGSHAHHPTLSVRKTVLFRTLEWSADPKLVIRSLAALVLKDLKLARRSRK